MRKVAHAENHVRIVGKDPIEPFVPDGYHVAMKPSIVSGAIRRNCCSLLVLLMCVAVEKSPAQATSGQWDEIVGKEIRNNQGVLLGRVRDSAVDLEHGRFVGMVVTYGGFIGIGEKSVIIPPDALRDDGTPRTLFLNMDEKTFRQAPTFKLSEDVGPPLSAKVAEVYRYFGQTPFFAVQGAPSTMDAQSLHTLGFVQKGSKILFLPVENQQGVRLGYVAGLRDLNRVTGRLKGVVIRPYGNVSPENMKVVQPQTLRYNRNHKELRLNDHFQEFKDSPAFDMSTSGRFEEENPERPGLPLLPPVQGESAKDKAITMKIVKRVMADDQLSNYGKTIEIKTLHGKTILRGRVERATARDRLVAYAAEAAGAGNVTVELEVRPMSISENAIDR